MAAPSFDDLYTIARAEMLLRRPDLFLAEGDTADFIVAMAAAMADLNVAYGAELLSKTFIDSATGDDLTALLDDHLEVQRTEETFAVVTLSFTRLTAAAGAGTIAAGAVVASSPDAFGNRIEFATDGPVSWTGAETGTKTTTATAVVGGTPSNVAAGQLTNIVNAVFDSSITVTNLFAAAGGNPQETDEHLRERARAFHTTVRRGTLDALEYGALLVPGVSVATAVEDTSTALVTVYVTDSAGGSNAAMVSAVVTELENWRCAGTLVQVQGGSVLTLPISVVLELAEGATAALLATDIAAALAARLEKLGVGETLRSEVIQATAISVDPDSIIGVTLVTPTEDTIPAAYELVRAGAVTVA